MNTLEAYLGDLCHCNNDVAKRNKNIIPANSEGRFHTAG